MYFQTGRGQMMSQEREGAKKISFGADRLWHFVEGQGDQEQDTWGGFGHYVLKTKQALAIRKRRGQGLLEFRARRPHDREPQAFERLLRLVMSESSQKAHARKGVQANNFVNAKTGDAMRHPHVHGNKQLQLCRNAAQQAN